jgi:hypothetical protein
LSKGERKNLELNYSSAYSDGDSVGPVVVRSELFHDVLDAPFGRFFGNEEEGPLCVHPQYLESGSNFEHDLGFRVFGKKHNLWPAWVDSKNIVKAMSSWV